MTVRPASVNFFLYQYANFSEPVIIKDSNGVPIDVTGYTAALDARRDIEDVTPVFRLTSENGGIIIGTTDGRITLNLGFASTAFAIDPDGEVYYHDLLLKNAAGDNVQRTFTGVIVAVPGVTRPPT